MAFGSALGLLFIGWLVAVAGAGACDENVAAGTNRADVCRVVGEGYGWPTIAFIFVPAIVLGLIGLIGAAPRVVAVVASLFLALELAALVVTILVAT